MLPEKLQSKIRRDLKRYQIITRLGITMQIRLAINPVMALENFYKTRPQMKEWNCMAVLIEDNKGDNDEARHS